MHVFVVKTPYCYNGVVMSVAVPPVINVHEKMMGFFSDIQMVMIPTHSEDDAKNRTGVRKLHCCVTCSDVFAGIDVLPESPL